MAKRKYTMTARLDKAYKNYVKRYKAKEAMLKKKGYEMASKMMKKRMYIAAREDKIYNEGITTNINQTLVSEQAYQYSQKTAQRLKRTAEKFDLVWKDKTITEIRKGKVDLSKLNNILKDMEENNPEQYQQLMDTLPDEVKRTRQGYISYYVFGSL